MRIMKVGGEASIGGQLGGEGVVHTPHPTMTAAVTARARRLDTQPAGRYGGGDATPMRAEDSVALRR